MKQNPLFSNIQTGEAIYDDVDRATYKGICAKTFFLLALAVVVAAIAAFYLPTIIASGNFTTFYVALGISAFVGFISCIVGRMSDRAAKYASVIYSACEGLFLGTLTVIVESVVPGIPAVAIFSTLVIFAVMLTLFATGILRVGSTFRKVCIAMAIGAIALLLFTSISSLFLDYGNLLGVLIFVELFLLVYGVITLGLNFKEAQTVVEMGASKGAEWSVALGLMVSIVYIYVQMIRVLLIFASNRD